MSLKVTFLTGEYPPMQGGIADHIARLAGHLSPLGVSPSVLIGRRWTETPAEPAYSKPGSDQTPVYPVIPDWGWRCWPAVSRFWQSHQPQIFHIHYQAAAFQLGGWINGLPWYLKQRKTPVSVVTTFHDLRIPYIFPKAGALRWKAILALARYSQVIICTNREDQASLSQEPWLESKPIRVIPLGSNVEPQVLPDFERTAWRAGHQLPPEGLLLAYFGFLNESKGGETLIEALALLHGQGLKAHLLLIGGDIGHADPNNRAYAQRVEQLTEALGLAPFVHRTGYVTLPEVSASLLAADLVVMPYRDGVSFRRTTLIAALRHGCPVVSTFPANTGFIPEIRPGENMMLVPPGNAVALAQGISRLVEDGSLRRQLAEGARQLGTLFEWERIARETAEVYQAIVPLSLVDNCGFIGQN